MRGPKLGIPAGAMMSNGNEVDCAACTVVYDDIYAVLGVSNVLDHTFHVVVASDV